MRHSVRRWLFCAGAVAAVGASAALQAGPASAAPVTPASRSAQGVQAAPASSYVPPTSTLHLGNHGPAVSSVQQRLNQLGYYAGPVDGQYGPDLQEAVWAFKEVQGLPMNDATISVITRPFLNALVNPRQPYVEVSGGRSGPDRDQPEHPGAGAVPEQQAVPDPACLHPAGAITTHVLVMRLPLAGRQ